MPDVPMQFLREFLREPGKVGAVTPSSRHLAGLMLAGLDLENAEVVVEIGPGTGAFTSLIRERIGPRTKLVLVEISETLAARLRRDWPKMDVACASAEELPKILEDRGHEQCDVVISGLPWAAFPKREQLRLLLAIHRALRPGGSFRTFAYLHGLGLPSAHRFRAMLERRFSMVDLSRPEWLNLPPASVYRCEK